ncbi:MAG: hypothetical protein R3F65_11475 [bacterium]
MRRLLAELVAHTALVLAAVLLLLLAGQLAQIGDLLWGAGAAAPWAAVLGRGALILLEAALPLAGLVGAGLVYGRLRSEGAWVAHAALGGHPLGALGPAVAVGGALAVAAAGLAHRVVPDAVAGLRVELVAAAGAALQAPDRVVALPGGGVARRAPGGAWWAVVPGAGSDGRRLEAGTEAARAAGWWSRGAGAPGGRDARGSAVAERRDGAGGATVGSGFGGGAVAATRAARDAAAMRLAAGRWRAVVAMRPGPVEVRPTARLRRAVRVATRPTARLRRAVRVATARRW